LATLGRPDQGRPSVDAIAVDRDNSDFGDAVLGGTESRRFDIDYREVRERVQTSGVACRIAARCLLSNERSIMSSRAITQYLAQR
jgi:hypothetical protein